MAEDSSPAKKSALDKDLKKIVRLEKAGRKVGLEVGKLGIGVLFLLCVLAYVLLTSSGVDGAVYVVAAGVIGGYMAMNIGANDVANNMGPAVGSKALPIMGALFIAAICETAGALIAGGDVVRTISKGIIDINAVPGLDAFIWAMLAALLAAAIWVNIATYIGAPVSTTHAIVGGVMGGGVAAAGWSAVDWLVLGKIAASWVVSPVMGGVIAALILYAVKRLVVFQDDRIAASRRWVPIFVAIMSSAFSVYLVMKGLKHVWRPGAFGLFGIGLAAFILTIAAMRPVIRAASAKLENRRKSVARLFTVPLIFSAALLSFAHGANDVANAVGPLAAVVSAVSSGGVEAEVNVPLWVLVVGAVGISAGLALYGPKLIRMVGEKITRLDPIRAYCVALAAAVTVIIASALGLPVSSTHIAVGGIFGVGFLREYLTNRNRRLSYAAAAAAPQPTADDNEDLDAEPDRKATKKALKKARKRRLVRRQHFYAIIMAWVITVPSAAIMSAMIYYMLRGIMLP